MGLCSPAGQVSVLDLLSSKNIGRLRMAPADRDLVVIVLGAGTSACYALERGAVRCIVWLDADVP